MPSVVLPGLHSPKLSLSHQPRQSPPRCNCFSATRCMGTTLEASRSTRGHSSIRDNLPGGDAPPRHFAALCDPPRLHPLCVTLPHPSPDSLCFSRCPRH